MGEMADDITSFAKAHLRHRVGSGECADLPDRALKKAGARSASDYGKITADADYVWGTEVALAKAESGDILQFRNHEVTVKTVTVAKETNRDGSSTTRTTTRTHTYTRGHHTAIVKDNLGGGVFRIYEQHVKPLGGVVQEHTLQVADSHTTSPKKVSTRHTKHGPVTVEVDEETTVTVTGSVTAYRPQAR
jgi:hypothetical protein